ncbi:hypothetical protein ANO11243_036830 [Dothideomycetidae sp. 11243]|nr:hypothetical protein ANO11243_036830 [fungal sp. No.11243]
MAFRSGMSESGAVGSRTRSCQFPPASANSRGAVRLANDWFFTSLQRRAVDAARSDSVKRRSAEVTAFVVGTQTGVPWLYTGARPGDQAVGLDRTRLEICFLDRENELSRKCHDLRAFGDIRMNACEQAASCRKEMSSDTQPRHELHFGKRPVQEDEHIVEPVKRAPSSNSGAFCLFCLFCLQCLQCRGRAAELRLPSNRRALDRRPARARLSILRAVCVQSQPMQFAQPGGGRGPGAGEG